MENSNLCAVTFAKKKTEYILMEMAFSEPMDIFLSFICL